MSMRRTPIPHPSGHSYPRRSWSTAHSSPPFAESGRPPNTVASAVRSTAMPDDVVDAGLDSFPASDPPSWSPLRIGTPAT